MMKWCSRVGEDGSDSAVTNQKCGHLCFWSESALPTHIWESPKWCSCLALVRRRHSRNSICAPVFFSPGHSEPNAGPWEGGGVTASSTWHMVRKRTLWRRMLGTLQLLHRWVAFGELGWGRTLESSRMPYSDMSLYSSSSKHWFIKNWNGPTFWKVIVISKQNTRNEGDPLWNHLRLFWLSSITQVFRRVSIDRNTSVHVYMHMDTLKPTHNLTHTCSYIHACTLGSQKQK
jgi:hypothetical protein